MKYSSLLFLMLFAFQINAQDAYQAKPLSEAISLHEYAVFANAGQQIYTLEEVRNNPENLDFRPIGSENPNIGFTKDQYWVKFRITNNTAENFTFYLETARPITDRVDLFSIATSGEIQRLQSGDKMAFSNRSFDHRKTIFELQLPSEETLEIYIR